ncbi:type II toxin-antitoxin system Phd/YefM family antitoxin [Sphingomonas sp. SUN039]|uniref:type II toxin-antitoxin system Phd/YefM family antitoxin n=1 Tax=Sphingomonas sp. SUN039 TaxID=2937787 RepID=UPI002164EA2D|nr:type II toxin-antitoxin system prevent-host-death family antitoxin [Sphingomonas sp. SUN039]UVO54998.1 type II toxin-antitoxin system prevent-host-death family antitoxin [Sphingomonas sp. SUN039]
MTYVNVHQAKSNLSRLLDAVESGAETEIVIARNGKPVGRLVPMAKPRKVLLGLAAGKYNFDYEAFQALDADVAKLFEDSADPFGERLQRP